MLLQALLTPRLSSSSKSSAQQTGLLDCAVMALLLNLLHYLLLQASMPPAPALVHHVDAILKVSLRCEHFAMSHSVLMAPNSFFHLLLLFLHLCCVFFKLSSHTSLHAFCAYKDTVMHVTNLGPACQLMLTLLLDLTCGCTLTM